MTISLAFLAPDLVKAAIDGRLPHGMGMVRLSDMPAEWSRQRMMLGLKRQRGIDGKREQASPNAVRRIGGLVISGVPTRFAMRRRPRTR